VKHKSLGRAKRRANNNQMKTKETYIVTNVHFVGEPIVDKVYSKLSTEQTLLVNGKTVCLGEDSKRIVMPKGVSYSQAEELAESLMNLDFIHSYQIIQE